MRKREEIKELGRLFCEEGDAFIHVEMEGHNHPELMLGGDSIAMLHCMNGIICRFSELTGQEYADTIEHLISMKINGYKKMVTLIRGTSPEKKHLEGEDHFEGAKLEVKRQAEHEAEIKINALRKELKEEMLRNKALHEIMSAKLAAKERQIKELNKTILKLEHEMKDLEERRNRWTYEGSE